MSATEIKINELRRAEIEVKDSAATEIRINKLREAGFEVTDDTATGIVSIKTREPGYEIVQEIKKDEPSLNPVARRIVDHLLGHVEAYRADPNTHSISLVTPYPERAAELLWDVVDYVHVTVPLDWGTLEQRMARAWKDVEEMRRARNDQVFASQEITQVAARQPGHHSHAAVSDVSEYPPSPRRHPRPRPYLHLLAEGPRTIQ
jgi:hypothetical protein